MRRRPVSRSTLLVSLGLLVGLGAFPAASPAGAASTTSAIVSDVARTWFKAQWAAYRTSFVTPEGRVVDNANGGVSHSEGQGYALLLAVAADDPAGFSSIWRWTVDHLQLRQDGLFAWRWDPRRQSVTDRNNASDGDILIAWALARAAKRFDRPEFGVAAARIAEALAAATLRSGRTGPVLLPAAAGFTAAEQPDGPVINLSYWVFPAFHDLAALSPGRGWEAMRDSGLQLLDASRFGPLGLPTDWESVAGPRPAPARNFPATFGYDAIRIPLYLAWDAETSPEALARFAGFASLSTVTVIDVPSGSPGPVMGGVGYRTVFALARCAADGGTIPPDLMTTRDPLYYPETLRLLSLSVAQERFPQCL